MTPLLLLLLLFACAPPTSTPTDLGEASTLTSTHLDAHLGHVVTVHGDPTPTRAVQNGTCRLYYIIGNRHVFINDCVSTDTLPTTHTGRLEPFSNLPQSRAIADFYATRFGLTVDPDTAYVIQVEPR